MKQNNKCCNESTKVNLKVGLKLKYTKIQSIDEA